MTPDPRPASSRLVPARATPVLAVAAGLALGALSACSEAESTQRGLDDVFVDEAGVIAENLAEQGVDVSADDVADADVTCPDGLDAGAGSSTTCRVLIAGQQVDVVLEFTDDTSFSVTSLTPVP